MLATPPADDLVGMVIYVGLFVLMSLGIAFLRRWWLRRTMPSIESRRAAISKLRRMQAAGATYKDCLEYLRQNRYSQEIADQMIGEATATKER